MQTLGYRRRRVPRSTGLINTSNSLASRPYALQANEPDERTDAAYRICHASLKGLWPAGYPQTNPDIGGAENAMFDGSHSFKCGRRRKDD